MIRRSVIKKYWENTGRKYAHLLNEEGRWAVDLFKGYHEVLLDHINFTLYGKTVIDYGCGGGWLGVHLFSDFGIFKYYGLDIAERSISTAKEHLKTFNAEILSENSDLNQLDADILFSFAVIQHFPDRGYLDGFLDRLERSGIPKLCLHIRHSDETEFNNAYVETRKSMGLACRTNINYISSFLKSYKVIYEGPIHPTSFAQGLIFEKVPG